MPSSILTTFLGSLQASLAVLLTISYGIIAARFNLLKEASTRDISKTCVRLFLPALIITNVGSELHANTAVRYVPVLLWALIYTLSSMALGWVLKRLFKFPAWTIPAIAFNNTTALPLLLVQSLAASGILDDLLKGPDDTRSAAVNRAKSYFLISSMVSNSLTFAVGPKLLDDENAPSEPGTPTEPEEHDYASGRESDEEHAQPTNASGRTAEEQEEHTNESTSLLPERLARLSGDLDQTAEGTWTKLPAPVQKVLEIMGSFVNAPLVGAIIGVVLGVTSPLHRAFFSEPNKGGIFKAWITSSLSNMGELFAALQLIVVGAKLSSSLVKMKQGKESGTLNMIPMLSVFFIRFILWPVISILVIYLIASKTSLLFDDPILYFVLMLLPTGPSATKLTALADVSGASEDEKMSIAKFIAASYIVSPVICLAVVGSLKAVLAIVR